MDCASRRGGAVAAWEDRGFSSRFTPAPGSLGGSPIAVARVIYLHFLDSAPPLLGRGSTHGKEFVAYCKKRRRLGVLAGGIAFRRV